MVADRYAGESFASAKATREREGVLPPPTTRLDPDTGDGNGNGRPADARAGARTGARRKATAEA
jgi:hypothetical protein